MTDLAASATPSSLGYWDRASVHSGVHGAAGPCGVHDGGPRAAAAVLLHTL